MAKLTGFVDFIRITCGSIEWGYLQNHFGSTSHHSQNASRRTWTPSTEFGVDGPSHGCATRVSRSPSPTPRVTLPIAPSRSSFDLSDTFHIFPSSRTALASSFTPLEQDTGVGSVGLEHGSEVERAYRDGLQCEYSLFLLDSHWRTM